MFTKGSRYQTVPEATFTDRSGREIRYKLRRPITDRATRYKYTVVQGDRLDLLADRAYADAEQFWRICDANRALWPEDLTRTPGRKLLIPEPGRP